MARGFEIVTQRALSLTPRQWLESVQRPSPLVVSIPHSGTWVPPEALGHIEMSRLVLIDTDILTDRVYAKVAELGSYVMTRVSPYVVNINRGYTKPEMPIIPRQLLSGQATLLEPLSAAQRRLLIRRYYEPYHTALRLLIKRAVEHYGFALVFDGHGMDRHGMTHTKDPGERRADLVVGDNKGLAADASITQAVASYLSRSGYDVGINKPYSGGHITRAYGNPSKRVHAIQIELVKGLYCEPVSTEHDTARLRSLKPGPGLPKLQNRLREALEAALRAAATA